MKTIWVVERTDHFGEFQPFDGIYHNRKDAMWGMDFVQKNESLPAKKYRLMQYVRQENRS